MQAAGAVFLSTLRFRKPLHFLMFHDKHDRIGRASPSVPHGPGKAT